MAALYVKFKNNFKREPMTSEFFQEEYLGHWIERQRSAYKKGKLSKQKIDKLNSLGFVWSMR
jgi:hypothetical protein